MDARNFQRPTPLDPDQPIPVTLRAEQWQQVLGILRTAPWAVADPIIREIVAQCQRVPDELQSRHEA